MRKAAIGLVRASALSSVLFLAGGTVPLLGPLATLFAPTPIMVYGVGRPAALARVAGSVALAAVLILLVGGPPLFLGYVVTFGLATLAMGYMLERGTRFELIVASTTALILTGGTIAATLMAGSPTALVAAMREMLSAAISGSEALYRQIGIGGLAEPEAQRHFVDQMVRLSPALAALAAAFAVLMNLAAFWRLAGGQRLSYKLFGDLARWSTPEWLIWAFIVTGFTLFVPFRAARTAALDGFVFVAAVYFCQGLAVMAYYLKVLATPTVWRGLLYLLVSIQPVGAALVSAVGVFDLWVDFRKLRPRDREAGGLSDFL